MPTVKPFRNQRPRFRNLSPPYAEKTLDKPQGYFPSRRNGRQIAFWDLRELAFIRLAESLPSIISYEERPQLFEMRCGPSWYRYVPHFRVDTNRGPAFVELSHLGQPATAAQRNVAVVARAMFADDGYRFVELSHSELRCNAAAANAAQLVRYLSVRVSDDQVIQVHDVLASGAASMRDVQRATGIGHGRLCSMVLRGDLAVSRHAKVGPDALISAPGAKA